VDGVTTTMTPSAAAAVSGRAPAWARGVYVANLVAQAGIVVTGAVVRITESGLGCPTWPECVDGSITPTDAQAESWHKYIEFGNRTLTFLLVLLAFAAILVAVLDGRRRRAAGLPARRALTLLAFIPLLGTVAQAVLGGITVLTGLHPLTVGAHLLLSMAVIAGVVALVARSGDDGDRPITWLVPTPARVLAWVLVIVSAMVVILGVLVTGSGPHSGDASAERLDIDPRTISWLHADVVLLFLGLTIGLLVALSILRPQGPSLRRTWLLLGVSLIQGTIGYVQYFTGVPEVLVGLHVLGATLVWIATLFIPPALRTRGARIDATA
jgi:cytochrome c oxidase assembly protein subunit 15